MKKLFLLCLFLLSLFVHSRGQSIVSVVPPSGARFVTLDVDITGVNTKFMSGSSTILFYRQGSPTADIRVNSIMPQSQTSLKANLSITGNAQNGSYPFMLFSGADAMPGIFTVGNEQLVSVMPASIQRSQTLNVTITGASTSFIQGSTTVQFFRQGTATADIAVNSVMVNSPTTLTANITAQPLAEAAGYQVVVDNKLFLSGFSVEGPKVTKVTPRMAGRNQVLSIDITGSDVNFTQGHNSVQFFMQGSPTSAITVQSGFPVSAGMLRAQIHVGAGAPLGLYDLRVYNSVVGNVSNEYKFQVTDFPIISSITPPSGYRSQQLNVTITGVNFSPIQGSNTLRFFYSGSETANISALAITPVNGEVLDASLFVQGSATVGFYDVVIINSRGGFVGHEMFEVKDGILEEGLEESGGKGNLRVYPNPAAQEFFFKTPSGADLVSFEMFDLTGKKLPAQGAEKQGDGYKVSLRDAQLPKGIYLVKVIAAGSAWYSRILIE